MINFSEIATRHLNSNQISFEERCCPDQFVGVISDIEDKGDFTCRLTALERPTNVPCVLLVLESPHKDEFGESPGPAKGRTGKNIIRYLRQAPKFRDKDNFGLVLLNAVQFQCSLGKRTSVYRDAVFRDVWKEGGRADFESRLETLYRAGDYVANCCTLGNSKKVADHLRIIVHEALISRLPDDTTVLRRNHPSSWHFTNNRTREWPYAAS